MLMTQFVDDTTLYATDRDINSLNCLRVYILLRFKKYVLYAVTLVLQEEFVI